MNSNTPNDGHTSGTSTTEKLDEKRRAGELPKKLRAAWAKIDQAALSKTEGGTLTSASEVRATDPETGGEKGRKPEEYALIPSEALAEVARVYGMGAAKYDPWNWARGYPWSWSMSAGMRHWEAFRRGEYLDPESGLPHLAHMVFHCFTLMSFHQHSLGTDDRWKP